MTNDTHVPILWAFNEARTLWQAVEMLEGYAEHVARGGSPDDPTGTLSEAIRAARDVARRYHLIEQDETR